MDGFKKRLTTSVQLRLAVALSLAILAVALAAGVFAFTSALQEAHEMQDDTLRQVAVLFDRQHMTLAYTNPVELEGDDEESRVIVQYLADGSKSNGNIDSGTPIPLPTTLTDGIYTLDVGGEPFRVLVRTTSHAEKIAVAQEIGARDKTARKSALRSLLPFLILFPILFLVVGDLVRKLFRPITALCAEIDQRADHALHPIEEGDVPLEVRPFVVAINRLLIRVGNAMQAQGRFVADAAHELRSPLTALSLQAERLACVPMSIEAQTRLLSLRRGIKRGRHLIGQLLSLTAAQSMSQPAVTSLSVHSIFRQVLEDLLPLAQSKQIDLGVEGSDDALVRVHEIDLLTLIKNLVDNAIRYTPALGRVDLSVEIGQSAIWLHVKDSGPGIAIDQRERVFDPFYRTLDNDQVGSGLGLAIVKTIADRIGAYISLGYSDEMGKRGLTVSVRLGAVAQEIGR